jgi:hypothetical protein
MTNIKYMKKAELLELAEEGGIEVPEGATNPEIRALLTAPPKLPTTFELAEEVEEPEGPTELEVLQEQLKELEGNYASEPSAKRTAMAKGRMKKIKERINLLS